VDEAAKVQPQYSQSISNLQLDYIQAVILKAVETNNQVAVNSLCSTTYRLWDNIRIYTGISDAVLEFNSNVAKAWASYFSAPQQ